MDEEQKIKDDNSLEKKPIKKQQAEKVDRQDKIENSSETKKSAAKVKKTTKKKASTTKKKKAMVDNIKDLAANQADDTNNPVKVIKVSKVVLDGSELQPTGQAGVLNVKVGAKAKNSVVSGIPSLKSNESLGTVDQTINHCVPASEPTFTASNTITATQVTTLPFFAVKVRNVVGKITNLTAEVICNKVIVQGIIHDQVFFVGNDQIVHHMADDGHFSTFLDIPGVQPGMNAQVTAIIEEIIPELAPDGLSLIKKIIIEIFVKVTESIQLNLAVGNGPTLLLNRVIGENSKQILLETDVTLFTPAIKIDEIVGTIRDIEVEVIKDKVIIQGILHKQIFFIDTANTGRHQAEDIHFSLFIDIPGACCGMDVQVQPTIEAIFFNLITPTVVRQKAVIEFFVKVTELTTQSVAIGTGPLLKVQEFIGENSVQQLNETTVILNTPAIKVREIIAKLQNLVTHVIPNKVIVQGIIHKQIFFIGTDNIEHHQAEDVPFSLFIDIPGIEPGENVTLSTQIEAVFFDLLSSTELHQKVIIKITALVSEEIQINVVIGTGPLFKVEQVIGENTKQVLVVRQEVIVSPVTPVKPVVTQVTVVSPAAEVIASQQILLQNTFQLPTTAIKIKEITGNITDLTFQVVPDGVLVEGTVNKTIIFVSTDNIVRSLNEQVPFTILVQIPGVTPAQITNVTVAIEDIIFSLNATGTAVNQTVVLIAEVEGQQQPTPNFTVVTDVTGPGINTTKVAVQGLVLTPSGAVFEQFNVVTDVSGPGILRVTKQTVLLQRVGEPAPTPITVVTNVQIADP